jgi:hypothetical protein
MIIHQLILHDFGNLQFQVLAESDDASTLLEICDNINFLMAKAGQSKTFVAEINELELQDFPGELEHE